MATSKLCRAIASLWRWINSPEPWFLRLSPETVLFIAFLLLIVYCLFISYLLESL